MDISIYSLCAIPKEHMIEAPTLTARLTMAVISAARAREWPEYFGSRCSPGWGTAGNLALQKAFPQKYHKITEKSSLFLQTGSDGEEMESTGAENVVHRRLEAPRSARDAEQLTGVTTVL